MNQILATNKRKNFIKFFKIQLILSIILILGAIIYFLNSFKEKEKQNKISKITSINAKLNSCFSNNLEPQENPQSPYFGRIICSKINLDYFIFNKYSESNLKVLPCKFSGKNLGEPSNICIIGHNYFDNRFFSNLDKLEIGDEILLQDLSERAYKYRVYKIYKTDESKVQNVIKQNFENELTLCTCTLKKNERLILKAKLS